MDGVDTGEGLLSPLELFRFPVTIWSFCGCFPERNEDSDSRIEEMMQIFRGYTTFS